MSVKVTITDPKTLLWTAPLHLSIRFSNFYDLDLGFLSYFRRFSHAVASEGMIFLSLEIQGDWISSSSLSS